MKRLNSRRAALLGLLVLAMVAAGGCYRPPPSCATPTTPEIVEQCRQQAAWGKWGIPLKDAVAVREDLLHAAGELRRATIRLEADHEAGRISDEQFAKMLKLSEADYEAILKVGDVAGVALRAGQAAFDLYLTDPGADTPDLLFRAAKASMAKLLLLGLQYGLEARR